MLAAATILAGVMLSQRPATAQNDDDWTELPAQPEQSRPSPPAQPERSHPAQAEQPSAQQPATRSSPSGSSMVCGELAGPASEPYTSIVARIDRLWGVNTPVYEAVRMVPPHINSDGCIFYNEKFMEDFLRGEADSAGQPDKIPMIYAVLAHEVGHFMHHDFSPTRRMVPSVTKELQADRFAGYTLYRLGIARGNITPFYSLGGDEFSGIHDHGFSSQRIAAFNQGWQNAQWNRAENNTAGIHGAEPSLSSNQNSQGLDTSATSEP